MTAARRQTPTRRRAERARFLEVRRSTPRREIGRGLSAVVFRQRKAGHEAAIKVFRGHWSADAVHQLLGGAPNPYSWCEDAVQCAFYRRRLLAELVPYWFGERLTVANARGVAFNAEARAWEMDTQFVAAFPAALHQPFGGPRDDELRDLGVLQRQLQQRLLEAGFVGLTWQAGLSNPVAANNFLATNRRRGVRGTGPVWCWIDLESGVPALFPINPLRLLTHYGLWAWRLRRPLFDDVLTRRLDKYLAHHAEAIDTACGNGTTSQLRQWNRELRRHQEAWWARSRFERGLECALIRGQITEVQAESYRRRPTLWALRKTLRALRRGASSGADGADALAVRLRRLKPRRWAMHAWRLATSTNYRRRSGRAYSLRRVRSWRRRGQLSQREAAYLCRSGVGPGARMTDFLVYDTLGTIGRWVPIWGGQDTATEHFFNRLGDIIVRRRGPLVHPVR